MLGYLHVPLSWTAVLKRTGSEALQDNIFDLAAQQAYYFFFALFPALLFLISVATFFPLHTLIPDVIAMLGRVAPRDAIEFISKQLIDLSDRKSGGILTLVDALTQPSRPTVAKLTRSTGIEHDCQSGNVRVKSLQ